MGHTFPKKSFRAAEIATKEDFDAAIQPIAEKVATGLNEHDISSVETGGAKGFPFASLSPSCYYTGHQVKAAVGMALTTGAAYAKPSQTSAAGNTATIRDTQEWQVLADDVTGAKFSESIETGEDILFVCACLQSAGWYGDLGVTPTARSNDEYRLQYAIRVDSVVYDDTITGLSMFPDPPPRQLYKGCLPTITSKNFDYRHIGWQQDGLGLPNHLQPARLTRCIPVVEGTHTVEVVARRITRLNGKPDNEGAGSSMQVFNRRLFILRIKGWSKAAGTSNPTLSISPWSEGEVVSAANLNTARLIPTRNALNDVVEASIQRGALHNEHIPSVVAYSSVTTLNPASAIAVCAGATASTYAGYGANSGWQLVHDGAGNNLVVSAGGGGFILTDNPGIMVVLANVQVRRIRNNAGSVEHRVVGNFIIRYKDSVNVQNYVAETEVSITPRNQTGNIPSAAGSGTFDSNYGADINYCEEDVALLWVFDTAVLLAANPNASTIQTIEVVCATYDASVQPPALTVNMETQKATLTAFMLKGVTLA